MYRQSVSIQLFQRSLYNNSILFKKYIILGSTGGTCTLVGSQIVANNLHYTRTSYIQFFQNLLPGSIFGLYVPGNMSSDTCDMSTDSQKAILEKFCFCQKSLINDTN